MDPIKCFYLEHTDRCRRVLTVTTWNRGCPDGMGGALCCVARWPLDEVYYPMNGGSVPAELLVPQDHPAWPTICDRCSRPLVNDDGKPADRQTHLRRIYRCPEDNREMLLREAPPGAMWFADWMIQPNGWYRGPDGHCLIVKVPGNHDWMVDSRANNCTLPNDNEHRCWVRHGLVPNITVDKNGLTCQAGAGSILVPNWHGHLRNGFLVTC